MGTRTAVGWCDSSFSGWLGCTHISPACDRCWAETLMDTRLHKVHWGPGQPRQRTSTANWRNPHRWNRSSRIGLFVQCDACGLREHRKFDHSVPPGGLSCCSNPECDALPESESCTARPRVFCNSVSDVFDKEVPIEWLADLLGLIRNTPYLDWLVLTKRIGNFTSRLQSTIHWLNSNRAGDDGQALSHWLTNWLAGHAPHNVWLGATVCNQHEADRDIAKLVAVPAHIRFLSIEPLLGEITLSRWLTAGIHWVIVGGESGHRTRPMHPEWVISLQRQCARAGVAFFFKQWGGWTPYAGVNNKGAFVLSGGIVLANDGTVYDPAEIAFPDGARRGEALRKNHDSANLINMYPRGVANTGYELDGKVYQEFPESRHAV